MVFPRVWTAKRMQLTCAICLLAYLVAARDSKLSKLSVSEIEERVQECAFPQALAAEKIAHGSGTASFTSRVFAILFPSSKPAINALLATAYISGPPNFLLALCPPNIDPSSLSIMVAFAVGGLLGDTFFHLLPEIFLGEDEHDKVRFVMLEPNRNLLLGVGILVGLATFMGMDKALRIATGGGEVGHSHNHTHSRSRSQELTKKKQQLKLAEETKKKESEEEHLYKRPYNDSETTGMKTRDLVTELAKTNKDIRKRASGGGKSPSKEPVPSNDGDPDQTSSTIMTSQSLAPVNPSVKLAGVLNLVADFTHNITDGLAMSSSFYASPALGATTTMAVFFHEIPHEVGDFALLIQSGFSKRAAMGAQFITAIGAFIGTLIGIFVQEYGGNSATADAGSAGLFGTSLQWGDMLLPFTAGTFLYVGTVGVIPELLETGSNKAEELRKTGMQFLAMAFGAAIMIAISWS